MTVRNVFVVMVVGLLALPGLASAEGFVYLQVEGFPGAVKTPGYEGWMAIDTFGWDSMAPGGSLWNLQLRRPVDLATVEFTRHAVHEGLTIKKARLVSACMISGKVVPILDLTLRRVKVTAHAVTYGGEGFTGILPYERVTLQCRGATMAVNRLTSAGAVESTTNVSCGAGE